MHILLKLHLEDGHIIVTGMWRPVHTYTDMCMHILLKLHLEDGHIIVTGDPVYFPKLLGGQMHLSEWLETTDEDMVRYFEALGSLVRICACTCRIHAHAGALLRGPRLPLRCSRARPKPAVHASPPTATAIRPGAQSHHRRCSQP